MRSIFRGQFVFLVAVISSLALAQPTIAAEPICPGGNNARADIVWCADFEGLENCPTGAEKACWQDNGFAGLPDFYDRPEYQFRIVPSGEAAVGNGIVTVTPQPGSSSGGYTTVDIPGGPHDEVNLRFYVKYSKSFMSGDDHPKGPGISGKGAGCASSGTLYMSQWKYYRYAPGDCDVGSFNLLPNQVNFPILQNNRWYLIEVQQVVDTACTDPTDSLGCNGIYRRWIDEQLVTEYTNVNWGGVTQGLKWTKIWGPRNYDASRVPPFSYEFSYDNFVISTGSYIGQAGNENPRGTADPSSPYTRYVGIEPFVGHHPAPDCAATSGYLGHHALQWRDGAQLQDNTIHAGFLDQCNDPPTPDQALEVTLTATGTGGGILWDQGENRDRDFYFPQQVIYGWMYLPSGNDYALPTPLAGFVGYANNNGWGNYLAATVVDGKWALVKQEEMGGATVVATSAQPVTFDQWFEFEIIVWEDEQAVSLMVDRTRIFEKLPVILPARWARTGSRPYDPDLVVGVIDFQGTAPFTVYYDDVSLGTASYWSCDAWHSTSCPFSTADDTTPPAAPGGLNIVTQ